MISKKGLIILVVVALILAIISVTLMASDSGEIKTTGKNLEDISGAGKVALSVLPSEVEDKLTG
jgi:hypothetical protein